jgi:hypothetical protein
MKLSDITYMVLEAILHGYQRSGDEDERKYFKRLVNWFIREYGLCLPVKVFVSEAAAQLAKEKGLGDLHDFLWKDQCRKMGDPGRKLFHFEHDPPVSQIIEKLIALSTPDRKTVEEILASQRLTWITKDENKRLNTQGFRKHRPANAYAQVGIVRR